MFARPAAIASATRLCARPCSRLAPPAIAEHRAPTSRSSSHAAPANRPGSARVGQAFVDALRPQVGGRTVSTYGGELPGRLRLPERRDGRRRRRGPHRSRWWRSARARKIVLGGYSQGAAVVDMLAGIPPLGNKIGEHRTRRRHCDRRPAISSASPPLRCSAIPSTKFSIPVTNSVFGGRAIDLCKDGDPICSRGRNPFAHSDYVELGHDPAGRELRGGTRLAGLRVIIWRDLLILVRRLHVARCHRRR